MTSLEPMNQFREGQDVPDVDSVYDFLYYDAKRISSFLSQFDNSGHLREVVQSESTQMGGQTAGVVKSGAGVLSVFSVEGEHSTEESSGRDRGSQRVYDPLWANALTFMDFLEEYGLICRDIAAARMGQFVLCSGRLSVIDLRLMAKLWGLKTIKQLIKSGYKESVGSKNRGARNQPQNVDLLLDIIPEMPHTTQAKLTGSSDVWCSLYQEGMSTIASDITLKHGTEIPGEWHSIGILDAKPEHSGELLEPDYSDGQEVVAKLAASIGGVIRNLVGRPHDHYGVTPLLIFRKIQGAHNELNN